MTKQEKAVIRAAMRWFARRWFFYDDQGTVEFADDAKKLERACARLAATKGRK